MIDRIDAATIFFVNLILVVILATVIWGATALLIAALAATPVMFVTIFRITLNPS